MLELSSELSTVEQDESAFWDNLEKLNRSGGKLRGRARPIKKPKPAVIKEDEIYQLGEQLKTEHDRMLFYLTYLTAARISEILETTKRDYTIDTDTQTLLVELNTAKNSKDPFREVPIPMTSPVIPRIINYIDSINNPQQKLFDISGTNAWNRFHKVIVTVKARFQRIRIKKYEHDINPHYLRHCRLTHLEQNYGFTAIQLMHFAGWSSPAVASTYIRHDWKSLRKMMK